MVGPGTETTRDFTATVCVVADGATALYGHDRLGARLAPGGHVEREEVPHAAARREVDPDEAEQPAEDREWFAPADPEARADELAPDVREIGRRAIETVTGGGA